MRAPLKVAALASSATRLVLGVAAGAAGVRLVVDGQVGATASTSGRHVRAAILVVCHAITSSGEIDETKQTWERVPHLPLPGQRCPIRLLGEAPPSTHV